MKLLLPESNRKLYSLFADAIANYSVFFADTSANYF